MDFHSRINRGTISFILLIFYFSPLISWVTSSQLYDSHVRPLRSPVLIVSSNKSQADRAFQDLVDQSMYSDGRNPVVQVMDGSTDLYSVTDRPVIRKIPYLYPVTADEDGNSELYVNLHDSLDNVLAYAHGQEIPDYPEDYFPDYKNPTHTYFVQCGITPFAVTYEIVDVKTISKKKHFVMFKLSSDNHTSLKEYMTDVHLRSWIPWEPMVEFATEDWEKYWSKKMITKRKQNKISPRKKEKLSVLLFRNNVYRNYIGSISTEKLLDMYGINDYRFSFMKNKSTDGEYKADKSNKRKAVVAEKKGMKNELKKDKKGKKETENKTVVSRKGKKDVGNSEDGSKDATRKMQEAKEEKKEEGGLNKSLDDKSKEIDSKKGNEDSKKNEIVVDEEDEGGEETNKDIQKTTRIGKRHRYQNKKYLSVPVIGEKIVLICDNPFHPMHAVRKIRTPFLKKTANFVTKPLVLAILFIIALTVFATKFDENNTLFPVKARVKMLYVILGLCLTVYGFSKLKKKPYSTIIVQIKDDKY